MLKITIAIVVLYYLIIIIWFKKKQKSTSIDNTIISKKALSIIGKSTFVIYTAQTSDNQTQNHEIDFQPMQIDFEMEYEDEEDIIMDLELEEIGLISNESIKSAQGLSFEEMAQALDIIQNDNKSTDEHEERLAVQTIAKMQQTDLFDLVIEHIEGERKKVEEMLNKYDNNDINNSNNISIKNEGKLDINMYL